MFSKEECLHDISALETESGYHAYVKRLLNYADCFYLTFMASETEESNGKERYLRFYKTNGEKRLFLLMGFRFC